MEDFTLDFALIESNGIRNKDPTRRRASKIFFSLSSPLETLRMDFSSVSTDKRNGSTEGGSISRSIDYDRCKKARQCPRSRPCIGNCIVAACRRLSRLSLLGINARTRALQVFSRKEQSSTACLGPTAWKKDLRSVNVSRERGRERKKERERKEGSRFFSFLPPREFFPDSGIRERSLEESFYRNFSMIENEWRRGNSDLCKGKKLNPWGG